VLQTVDADGYVFMFGIVRLKLDHRDFASPTTMTRTSLVTIISNVLIRASGDANNGTQPLISDVSSF
jgi:hypothetical protein